MYASTIDKIYRKLLNHKQELSESTRLRLENQFLRERVAELEEQLRK
jgi:regulator of replication initiation timing